MNSEPLNLKTMKLFKPRKELCNNSKLQQFTILLDKTKLASYKSEAKRQGISTNEYIRNLLDKEKGVEKM